MLLFVVTVAAGTGSTRSHRGTGAPGLVVTFPAWSVFNSVLRYFCSPGPADSDPIGRRAGLLQAILTAAAVTALWRSARYRFNLHWAITFSILICYIMSLHNTIRGVFGRRPTVSTTRHT